MTTSTTPSPQEEMQSRLTSIRYKLDSLQSSARLSSLRDSIDDMDTRINGLRPCVNELRRKGYIFNKGLESKADGMTRQWRTVRPTVVRQIDQQAPSLENDLRPLASQFSQLQTRSSNPAAIKNPVERLEKDLDMFESRVRSAENSIRGMYDSLSNEVNTFKSELDKIEWTVQQLAEACFQLMPTECVIMAVKATYSRDEKMGNDDPKGILFLTDQRLLFEQKQEVATKKILFITTEKQKVQQLVLDVPVGRVDKVTANKKGLFGHEDHLALNFKPGSPVMAAWLHLDGQDCNLWQGLIGQARTGDFDDERTVEVDQKVVEKVRSAPSKCPSCGAPITQTILRGMDSLQCEYCSFVIRL